MSGAGGEMVPSVIFEDLYDRYGKVLDSSMIGGTGRRRPLSLRRRFRWWMQRAFVRLTPVIPIRRSTLEKRIDEASGW